MNPISAFRRSAQLTALGLLGLAGVAGCAADGESWATTSKAPGIRGTLTAVVVDGPGTDAGLKYWLKRDDGQGTLPLVFEQPPADFSRADVIVYGTSVDGAFRVASYEFLKDESDEAVASQALTGQSLLKSRTVGFAVVNYYGRGLSSANTSIATQAASFMYSTTNAGPNLGIGTGDKSVRQYYDEVSYGMFRMSEGTGPGVEMGGGTGLAYSGGAGCGDNNCDILASALTPSLTGTYDHHIWYYSTVLPECSGGYGWGSQGTWSRPEGEIWFNGEVFDGAITHEIGHNLGFQHASTIKCGNVPLADDPLTCTTVEYGNTVSIMGNMGNGHMMGLEKWYAGWLLGCNGVRVKSTGTFTLFPLEIPCNGIQTLQVPMPKTTRKFTTEQSSGNNPLLYYYLELRTSQGLDTGQKNQIMVFASDDIKAQSSWCARNVQLDMKPSTNAVDGLVAGDTFSDPAGGVTITVNSLSATQASVTVTLTGSTGSNTCIDGSTLPGSGPTSCTSTGTGGTGGTGGASSVGGTTSTGGTTAKGGMTSTGGTAAKGGTTSTGGTTAKGGMTSTGGTTAKGGATASGGATSSGSNSGGAAGRTGTSSTASASGTTATGTTAPASGGNTSGTVVGVVGGSAATGTGGANSGGSSSVALGGGNAELGGGLTGIGGVFGATTTLSTSGASEASGVDGGEDGGCGCRVAGLTANTGKTSLFAVGLFGIAFLRRRRTGLRL